MGDEAGSGGVGLVLLTRGYCRKTGANAGYLYH